MLLAILPSAEVGATTPCLFMLTIEKIFKLQFLFPNSLFQDCFTFGTILKQKSDVGEALVSDYDFSVISAHY